MKRLLSFSLMLFACFSATAQETTDFSEVSFKTKDGITINGVFQNPAVDATPAPAVILIHQGGSNKEEWLENPLTEKLLKAGYAVLVYDVRLHGDSEKDEGDIQDLFNNPKRAPLDLQAAIAFLKQDKKIDAKRIGIVGASIGANLACVAAASKKYTIKSVVSISAKSAAVQNLSGEKELKAPNNAFHIASKAEQDGKRAEWANELYALTTGKKKVEIAEGNKHGSYIIAEHPALQQSIIEWFKETL